MSVVQIHSPRPFSLCFPGPTVAQRGTKSRPGCGGGMKLPAPITVTPQGNLRDGEGQHFLWVEKRYAPLSPWIASQINHADCLARALDDLIDWADIARIENGERIVPEVLRDARTALHAYRKVGPQKGMR